MSTKPPENNPNPPKSETKKTLEQLLLEMNTDRLSRSKNRVAFLRRWPEIKAMLDKGWTLKSISQALRANGDIALGYEGLRKLVVRQRALEEKKGGS